MGDHCKNAVIDGVTIRDSIGREQKPTIIPERDVYRLVMRSKLPAAEQFEEWLVSEVLPSIRKTGSYNPRDIDTLTPAEKIARSNAACLELANQFGFSGNQALLSASKATEDRVKPYQTAGGRTEVRPQREDLYRHRTGP
ncbi:Bro-N domain-containing protein [Endozoicomonas sp. ONNA2]|uniref:BRO-N domain-containing protein n=1 Tax=Endozoicomonas sp. ONNA2 TaxID=2828741 RepID=UPI0035A0082E